MMTHVRNSPEDSQSESHVWVHVQMHTYPFHDCQMTGLTRSIINLDVTLQDRGFMLICINKKLYPPDETVTLNATPDT